jgi:2-hydroxy-3-keto-5-methylthiopentenyl-1-phosphate phosphatase
MALKVFVDFDGTITSEDVGNSFFRQFAGPIYDDILSGYTSGHISARDCFRRGVESMGPVNLETAREFVR